MLVHQARVGMEWIKSLEDAAKLQFEPSIEGMSVDFTHASCRTVPHIRL